MEKDFDIAIKKDYKSYICLGITFLFCGLGFLFLNSFPRLVEAIRDLSTSIVYYFYGLLAADPTSCPVPATVLGKQSWQITESRFKPFRLFPWTWEEFKGLWNVYWDLFVNFDNIQAYFGFISNGALVIARFFSIAVIVYFGMFLLKGKKPISEEDIVDETLKKNDELYQDTPGLKRFKKFLFLRIYPLIWWCKDFLLYVQCNKKYYRIWLALWLLYFNVISIGLSFFAFYLYFIVSFDFISVYTQIVKLLADLTPAIRFVPGIVWFIIGFIVLNYLANERGYANLEHRERRNRGFLNERGVANVIWGNMGTGKTRMLTSLALSAEKQLRDQALEILLETDMMFPNFPWVRLRAEVKRRMESHMIVDVFSIRHWIRDWKARFMYLEKNGLVNWFQKNLREGKRVTDVTFGYDTVHYRSTYNDNLKIIHLYDAIENYAQAYFIYAIQTSLIVSNYAIRTDFDRTENGHFPIYNDDFFRRKPQFKHLYSKYSHILDFDILRLGKRMLDNNPNRNALGFSVIVVSEIDKERKNELEIRKQASAKKKTVDSEEKCTQNNDLFNACVKMIRHAAVIANRVFIIIICDLQRPEDYGANAREVGELTFIDRKGEKAPVLPFYSPYWIIRACYFIHRIFFRFYLGFISSRDDNTLLLYIFKNITAFYVQYIDRIEKLFGCQTFYLEVESGRMDGKALERKFYGMDKKDFSERYSTDAMSSIFDLPNTVSIAMFVEYADIMATQAERAMQHSHFQADIDEYINV